MSLHLDVAARARDAGWWRRGDPVVVAVSGGRDSMALLHLLRAGGGVHGGDLRVLTVDHGTRPGSAEDAAFVEAHAAGLGLPCAVVRLGLGPAASEAALREARHAVFAAQGAVVVLAHHQRDQAETALLGWLRGGGTRALAGMAARRDHLVRPLLTTPPEVLHAWADARGVPWREDPSNQSPRFLRNRVRRELLPLAESLRGGAVAALARGAGHAAEDDGLLEALSVQAERAAGAEPGGLPAAWVATGPAPLVRRALLRRWPDLNAGQLDAVVRAAAAGRGAVALSDVVTVRVRARDGGVWVSTDEGAAAG